MPLKERSRDFKDLVLKKVTGIFFRKFADRFKELRLGNEKVWVKSSSVKAFPFKLQKKRC